MALRHLVPGLVGSFLLVTRLGAQGATGTIAGRVVDSTTQQPVGSVNVVIQGTQRGAVSRDDGSFIIGGVPVGTHSVRASRIGFAPQVRDVTVTAGGTIAVQFYLARQAAVLSEVVVTGYGTQRREAISGSVSTVNADAANVGVMANVNQMLSARVAGVQTISNSGEPGAGVQIRIRGGTSISASNDPLYVVDGVPLQNEETTPGAAGVGSINRQLARNPLNSINPNDIESITVLKDAAATAIYGSRGANGVVLIQTKKAGAGAGQMEYEAYVGASMPTKRLDLATGNEYRTFVTQQVAAGKLPATASAALGTADTDWEKELTRTGVATNHNLAFSGGSQSTLYRASLNYFKQNGAVVGNGLERYQGRLNATHDAFTGRLRLGLNLMAARVNNTFAPVENGGGFLGGLFTNMVIFNPTYPLRCSSATASSAGCVGKPEGSFYETGAGALDVRNPYAMAVQLEDLSPENRVLGNFAGTVNVMPGLTAQTTLGVDYTDAARRTFFPRSNPVGAQFGGYARQADRSLQNINFQQLLTYTPHFGANHELEVVGGYEHTTFDNRGFEVQVQGFITDRFGVNNLGSGTRNYRPDSSYRQESRLVSFFSRANYGFAGRYFLTGVVRRDGSSRLAPGRQWELFPAVSASWRLSEEGFMSSRPFSISTLGIRAGWGKQGNQAVAPYQTLLLLRADPGATYPFGGTLTTGLRAAQVGNDSLKWETATQTNVGIDYGLRNNRITGTLEVYQKKTKDLLLEVDVPQPAVVQTRIENVGTLRNRGLEGSINAQLIERAERTLNAELVFSVERNEVTSLGGNRKFINSGFVSGQGQSNEYSQRILVGEPLGTFFAPKFLRVETTGANAGKQIYACKAASAGCVNGETTSPTDDDRVIAGTANPNFTLGLSNAATWRGLDVSWLWRGEFGGKVFNNTALVYQTKSNAKQGRNFLSAALADPDDISEPAKYSTRWIEERTFVRLQNVTVGYKLDLPSRLGVRSTRVYVSGDNLLLSSDYSGYDPEVYSTNGGLAVRGVDYLTYPRSRTFTVGAQFKF
jgi:TonB-dependent starch-binding outer membrane protein SusC